MDEVLKTLAPTLPAVLLVTIGLFGVGVATFADKINEKDWKAVRKITICVVALALVALAIPGFTVLQGAVLGFAAAGTLTGVSFIGKKMQPPVVG